MAFYHHFPTLRSLPPPAQAQQPNKAQSTILSLSYIAIILFLAGLLILPLLSVQEGILYLWLATNIIGILVYRDIYNWKRSQESLDVDAEVDA